MFDPQNFQKALPSEVGELLAHFNRLGFKAGVVGGIPRDFLRGQVMGHDFDVELRPLDEEGFLARFEGLPKELKKLSYRSREKGYKVFEVELDQNSVEFTLPRIESFNDKIHHSNFDAEHIADVDYSKGFLRRDFTINAIMLELWDGEWRLVDPLGGVQDIKSRLLRACDNQSFVRDPVRFLRAVRFAIKLGFSMDLSLLTLVKNMELRISSHYLKTEAVKSLSPFSFFSECEKLRPETFDFGSLESCEDAMEKYDKLFFDGDLKKHIGQALILPLKMRKKIFESVGLGSKGALEINLKEVNLGTIESFGLNELCLSAWVKPFMDFLSRSAEFSEKKLNWLLKEEGAEFDADFIEKYHQLSVKPDTATPPKLKGFEVLKLKVQSLRKV